MIKTIFFDLDGTLLPMNQDLFIQSYLGTMAKRMADYGYDPHLLIKSIWAGTAAVTRNISDSSNESVFWEACTAVYGGDIRRDEHLFLDYYANEFQKVKDVCGFDSRAAETIRYLQQQGFRLVLATNPLFPAVATHSRIRWAGLSPENFELVTTYENATRCKPNPDYYWEILHKLDLKPEECLMVGNDAEEDVAAAATGMQVFVLTDCLINKNAADISQYPNGSFPELLSYIGSL